MHAAGRHTRSTTHPAMGPGEVFVLRAAESPSFIPAAVPRRSGERRLDAWIVMALLVATTALAVYDTYVLLAFAPQ